MTRENVDVVRTANEALAAGDAETALACIDPDVEWHGTVGGLDEGAVYRGRDEVVKAFLAYFDTWERLELRVDEYIDAPGDDIVAFHHEVARGRESRVLVETDTGSVYTVRGGRIVRVRAFMDREQARRAAGVAPAPSENVEIVRRIYEAAERRDDAAAFELYAEDIVWDFSNSRVAVMHQNPIYRGHEGVRQAWREGLMAFSEVRLELEELSEVGGRVLATVREHEIGRSSGVPVQTAHYAVWTLRDGKVTHMRTYDEREQALEAARAPDN